MAFTRAQASALLNRTEMRLFDDSRANALRGLDRSDLDSRITRARASRDRARDLLKRQRGAARTQGRAGRDGVADRTSRKEALLVEILQRFTDARKDAPAATRKAAAKKSATRTSVTKAGATKKTAAKKAPAKKAATTQAATKKAATKKAATKKASAKKAATTAPTKKVATKPAATKKVATKKAAKTATGKTVAKRSASPAGGTAGRAASATPKGPAPTADASGKAGTKKPVAKDAAAGQASGTAGSAMPARSSSRQASGSTRRGRLTPERALEQTRQLLEAKQERDRSPQPWQTLDPAVAHLPQPGYQSEEAAAKARDLHDGEARIPAIQGSSSRRDRIHQGKRDHRGDND